jgi:hypothetical protein
MGGLGGSPSRRAPGVLPSPRISIAAHSLTAAPSRRDGGGGGKGGQRVDTCFWCPRGGTGAATAGNERRLPPGQASGTRWPGGAVGRPVLRDCVLWFSFPATGGTPGWVGRWFCDRASRSVLPGPRAACGASRRPPLPQAGLGASVMLSLPSAIFQTVYRQPINFQFCE